MIGSFKVFTQAFVITQGGPLKATYFYLFYFYEEAFQNFNMGYASALAADGRITLDGNHPFAGKTMKFRITTKDVRDASESEATTGVVVQNHPLMH